MTDEFYRCKDCKAFNEGSYTRLELKSEPRLTEEQQQQLYTYCGLDITELVVGKEFHEDDIKNIQEALDIELDVEEITHCSECGGTSGGIESSA